MDKFNLTPFQDPDFVRTGCGAQNVYLIGKAKIIVVVTGKVNRPYNKGSDGHYIVSAPGFQSTVSYYQRHAIEDAQAFAHVHYAIELLSEKHREVITLRLIKGYDEEVIAVRLGLTLPEYKALYASARKELTEKRRVVKQNSTKESIKLKTATHKRKKNKRIPSIEANND